MSRAPDGCSGELANELPEPGLVLLGGRCGEGGKPSARQPVKQPVAPAPQKMQEREAACCPSVSLMLVVDEISGVLLKSSFVHWWGAEQSLWDPSESAENAFCQWRSFLALAGLSAGRAEKAWPRPQREIGADTGTHLPVMFLAWAPGRVTIRRDSWRS